MSDNSNLKLHDNDRKVIEQDDYFQWICPWCGREYNSSVAFCLCRGEIEETDIDKHGPDPWAWKKRFYRR